MLSKVKALPDFFWFVIVVVVVVVVAKRCVSSNWASGWFQRCTNMSSTGNPIWNWQRVALNICVESLFPGPFDIHNVVSWIPAWCIMTWEDLSGSLELSTRNKSWSQKSECMSLGRGCWWKKSGLGGLKHDKVIQRTYAMPYAYVFNLVWDTSTLFLMFIYSELWLDDFYCPYIFKCICILNTHKYTSNYTSIPIKYFSPTRRWLRTPFPFGWRLSRPPWRPVPHGGCAKLSWRRIRFCASNGKGSNASGFD